MASLVEVRFEGDNIVTDWGVIEHSEPLPERGQVGAQILITPRAVRELLKDGPRNVGGAIGSVKADGRRMFARLDYYGKHWTWELFPAYFADNQGPPIIVGMWPD